MPHFRPRLEAPIPLNSWPSVLARESANQPSDAPAPLWAERLPVGPRDDEPCSRARSPKASACSAERRYVAGMPVNVVCVGGPSDYAGKEFANVEPEDGYFWFQGSTFGGPEAWYKIDDEANPVASAYGPARPAAYVGTTKDG